MLTVRHGCGKISLMTETTYAPPTNKAVADKLGMSESGVSRLRSGDRMPSLSLMQRIQEAYGWSVQQQSDHRAAGTWTTGFEAAVTLHEATEHEQREA